MSPTPSEQNNGSRQSTRPLVALIALGVLVLLFLASPYSRDPVWHARALVVIPVLFLVAIIAVAASQARPRVRVIRAVRAISPEELKAKGIDVQALASQLPTPDGSRKQIHNLSELPPAVASRPEIRKLFEDGMAAGGTMWVSTSTKRLKPEVLGGTENAAAKQISGPIVRGRAQGRSGALLAFVLIALFVLALALIVFRSQTAAH